MCHLPDIHNNTIQCWNTSVRESKFKEQHLITRVSYQLMQSHEGRVIHRLQTPYGAVNAGNIKQVKQCVAVFENFIYLQFILSTEDVIQGILFSVPCLISHHGARRNSLLSTPTAPLRLCHVIHQMFKGMCRYFENHNKLSTKCTVKVRTLIVQLENHWGPDLYHLLTRW